MGNKLFLIAIAIQLFVFQGFSQETDCRNGRDDDGDGLVDCYDGDCASESVCDDFFLDTTPGTCNVNPPITDFEMVNTAGSSNRNVHTQARIVIGDLNNDGIPEVVTPHKWDQELRIIYSTGPDAGETQYQSSTTVIGNAKFRPELEVAIANLDNDDCGEVFSIERAKGDAKGNEFNGNYYLVAYNCRLEPITTFGNNGKVDLGPDNPGIIGLADLDGDGEVEIYFKDEVWDAKTGVLRDSGNLGDWDSEVNHGPVAMDINPNSPGMELIVGGTIYNYNSGTLSEWKSLDEYYTKDMGYATYSTTSVADINGDGNLDVVMTGAEGSNTGPTTVFFWDVTNNTFNTINLSDTNDIGSGTDAPPENDWLWGTGRVTLSDTDGDGLMNAVFVSGSILYNVEINPDLSYTIEWWRQIEDSLSGIIGVTAYDFDNDGIKEIVYRDATFLSIISGTDGSVIHQEICQSHTFMEYPLIVDANGDGNTNIVVPCNFSDNSSAFKISDGLQQQGNGNLRIYEAAGAQYWVPTRDVWNQHGYHVTNVNDDLSIPREFTNNAASFPGNCYGDGRTVYPFNNFMVQTPSLDANGCPSLPGADLVFDPIINDDGTANFITVNPPTCPDEQFTIDYVVKNDGDVAVSDNLLMTLYAGDPTTDATAQKLLTIDRMISLAPGDTITVSDLPVQGDGTPFQLYIVLDDDGTNTLPLQFPLNGSVLECNYTNNITNQYVEPLPFPVEALKVQDNIKCDDTYPDVGAARAYKLNGIDTVTAGYTFDWYEVGGDGSIISTGPYLTGVPEGEYFVIATNDAKQCSGIADTVLINPGFLDFDDQVQLIQEQTFCVPPNGELYAFVADDDDANYTFEWYSSDAFGILDETQLLGTGQTLSGLEGGVTYGVRITSKVTGCPKDESITLPVNINIPVLTLDAKTDITSCDNPVGTANVSVSGVTTGYTFNWYIGTTTSTVPDFTGAGQAALAENTYTVVAVDDVTGCSDTINVDIADDRINPTVDIRLDAIQTSCTSVSNGELSAAVNEAQQDPDNPIVFTYSFEWFRGPNTLPSNSIGTGISQAGLASNIYTVVVTNDMTGCTGTNQIFLPENLEYPSLSLNKINDYTRCDYPDGELEAAVTHSNPANVTVNWYNSSSVENTVDNTGLNYTDLYDGDYTVQAVDNVTGCESQPATITVEDRRVYPLVTETITDVTSCLTPNGEIETVVDEGGTGVTTGYTWSWFNGSNIAGTPVNSGNVQGPAGNIIRNVNVGTYTAQVVDNSNACETVETYDVLDAIVIPEIATVNVSDVDQCGTPNGSIEVDVTVPSTAVNSDYTFEWYTGSFVDPANLISGETGPIIAGYPEGTYSVRAINNITGCVSNLITETINNVVVPFTIDITPTDPTSCDPSNPNGQLSASVPEAGTYTYEWYQGSPISTDPLTFGSSSFFAGSTTDPNLAPGVYTVVVTNTATNCVQYATQSLRASTAPEIDVTPTNLTGCIDENGELDVSFVSSDNNYTYDIFVYEGTNVGGTETGSDLDVNTNQTYNYNNLAAGSYTVIAIEDRGTEQCESNIETVTLSIQAKDPIVTATITNNRNCTDYNGIIQIGLQTDPADPVSTDWEVIWDATTTSTQPEANITIASGDSYQFTDLEPGTYTATFRGTASGCEVRRSFTVGNDPVPAFNMSISKTDRVDCIDQGTISVSFPTENPNDFEFFWYEGASNLTSGTAITGVSGTVLNETIYPDIKNGVTYYVEAIKINGDGTGCQSRTLNATINDLSVDPAINIQTVGDISCEAPPLGEAYITLSNAGSDTYTFTWYESIDASSGAGPVHKTTTGVTSDSDLNLAPGDYSIEVLNENTGCSNFRNFTIEDRSLTQEPIITQVSKTDPQACDLGGEGGVVEILQNGTSQPLSDFTYTWYTPDENTEEQTGPDFYRTDLDVATYFIVAEDNLTGCQSAPAQIRINDDRPNPELDIIEVAPQQSCVDTDPNGELSVLILNEDPAATYTYEWIDNSDPNTVLSTTETVTGLGEGSYSVIVRNNLCESTAGQIMVTSLVEPTVAASSTADIICGDDANGTVTGLASVDDPRATEDPTFSYIWYNDAAGTDVLGSTQSIIDLPEGTYYVQATQTNGNQCTSEIVAVNVAESLTSPTVRIVEDAPVTNCLEVGNGQLSAYANGNEVAGFTFNWVYTDEDGNTEERLNNNTFLQAAAGEYYVEVINNFTQCVAFDTTDVEIELPFFPKPAAFLIDNDESCDEDNGKVGVKVEDLTVGYSFTWYLLEDSSGTYTDNIVSYQDIVDGLSYSKLKVDAVDVETGCYIGSDSVSVAEINDYPNINVLVENDICSRTEGGTGEGSAILNLDNNDVILSDITWNIDGALITGGYVDGLFEGFYSVTATGYNGCQDTYDFEVGLDIQEFNAVTSNGDNLNEYFHISCIASFPDNQVKIFNRAGMLVFEMEAYDNSDPNRRFNGLSNSGVNTMGNTLPIGTYFYVIDLMDGSKPLTGYLELLR
ncbi:gliding motility-associated C-terminal domain-containing protein [Mangrovivirga sp. M17]|uniref:Gliding motility-associated C-terminal domain-containing protein n=1 Tax=Mangrovivirga halotolerans TaxID=2993936 RepID=A0ABT3RWH1_9BACT|nr:gliding motility-associated C-terminal domain-containing protein [Mangrovivirga halotolerans]MCX2746134.1 gliding motility-associated C-terminal domain-containing protein [Mangrovivirga halotolerans]